MKVSPIRSRYLTWGRRPLWRHILREIRWWYLLWICFYVYLSSFQRSWKYLDVRYYIFEDICILVLNWCHFLSFKWPKSRDHTKLKISDERFISETCFLYVKWSDFPALSIGTNFGFIWELWFFTYSGGPGKCWGRARAKTAMVQKYHQVVFH